MSLKSINQRIRITENKKIVRRPMNTDHFRLSKPKKLRRQKRKKMSMKIKINKII
jgi:ribosomal protein L35